MPYIVTAPLVVAKTLPDGANVYLYEHSLVPDSVPPVEIERLVDGEFIADVDEIAKEAKRVAKALASAAAEELAAAEQAETDRVAAEQAEFDAKVNAAAEKLVAEREAAAKAAAAKK